MAERRATLVVSVDQRVDAERKPQFLQLRRVTMRLEGEDGWTSDEGVWDFVERPAGLDAVVVAIYRRAEGRVEVLLREGLRVPASMGREGQPRGPGRHPAVFVEEIVAGLVERGEGGADGLRERARQEVREETGLVVLPAAITPLGSPLWATPGLCAEVLYFFAADATDATIETASGDGSPFEALSTTTWHPLDVAIARVSGEGRGDGLASLGDLRAELGLRRLAASLARA